MKALLLYFLIRVECCKEDQPDVERSKERVCVRMCKGIVGLEKAKGRGGWRVCVASRVEVSIDVCIVVLF